MDQVGKQKEFLLQLVYRKFATHLCYRRSVLQNIIFGMHKEKLNKAKYQQLKIDEQSMPVK